MGSSGLTLRRALGGAFSSAVRRRRMMGLSERRSSRSSCCTASRIIPSRSDFSVTVGARQSPLVVAIGGQVSQPLWDQGSAVTTLLEPTYDAIFTRLRASPVVGVDQTGWPDLEDTSLPPWRGPATGGFRRSAASRGLTPGFQPESQALGNGARRGDTVVRDLGRRDRGVLVAADGIQQIFNITRNLRRMTRRD